VVVDTCVSVPDLLVGAAFMPGIAELKIRPISAGPSLERDEEALVIPHRQDSVEAGALASKVLLSMVIF
jgi:hypothetical protein